MGKAVISSTQHELPFERLSWRDFERLCLALVDRLGYEKPEHLGAAGGEKARDIRAWKDNKLVIFQCKRVTQFGPSDAEIEVETILALPAKDRPQILSFMVTKDISVKTRDRVAELLGKEIEAEFWGLTELDNEVCKHTDIVEKFFGGELANQVNRGAKETGGQKLHIAKNVALQDIGKALLECGGSDFDDHQALIGMINSHEKLRGLRHNVSEARNRQARVDMTMAAFCDVNFTDGSNALAVLLSLLHSRLPDETQCKEQIGALFTQDS